MGVYVKLYVVSLMAHVPARPKRPRGCGGGTPRTPRTPRSLAATVSHHLPLTDQPTNPMKKVLLRSKKLVDIFISQVYLVFTEREEIPPLNQPSSVTGCEIFDKEAESRAAARRAYVVYLLHCMRERGQAREPLHIEKGAGESWEAAMRHRSTTMSNVVLTDESFESILVRITKTQGEKRKLICQAFRASLADIMNSKSTARVNAFARVASALPEWAKIKKAVFIFSGGFKYHSSAKAVERYYDETLSVVSYNAKEKAFYMRDGLTPEAFAVATSQYHGIMAFDYDAVTVKAEPRATLDLEPLIKALEKAKDNRHLLSAMDRKALVEIWDAACAALPHKLGGRELTAQDIIPKAAAVDGKPTDTMPAKPVRKRAENNK